MNYVILKDFLKELKYTYEKLCVDNSVKLIIGKPATTEEIEVAEQTLGRTLPTQLREFLLHFSKNCSFSAHLPNDFKLPADLDEIFCAEFVISLDEIISAEKSRKDWASDCFSDTEDEYDKVWHNKCGFMTVANGDVIAFDTETDSDNPPVVYLSHDDGEGHGYVLGKDFDTYFRNLLLVGACGNEDWQMLPFCQDATSGIDAFCNNAKVYRNLIHLNITSFTF